MTLEGATMEQKVTLTLDRADAEILVKSLKLLTIVEFETGQEVIESVIATIRLALIAAGVEFCSEGGCIGIVRLKDIMSVTVPDAIKAELGADNDATE